MDDTKALFEYALPVCAALVPTLDTAAKEEDPSAALRTKECVVLWFVYFIVAIVAERLLFEGPKGQSLLPYTVYGFFGFLLGFPMILQSKFFTVRLPNSSQDTSIGFELLLQIFNRLLVPEIRRSVQEHNAKWLARWLKCSVPKLGAAAKNYVGSHQLPPNFGRTQQQMIQWINTLVEDASKNPDSADVNLRTLYFDIYKLGGARGVRWIVNNC